MRIGITATQEGLSDAQKRALAGFLLWAPEPIDFHHGDCIGGDEQGHKIARAMGVEAIIIHPPDIDKKRAFCEADGALDEVREPKPYLVRNRDIVDEVDLLIVCPRTKEEERRSGTWSTYRYAKDVGRPTLILWP